MSDQRQVVSQRKTPLAKRLTKVNVLDNKTFNNV